MLQQIFPQEVSNWLIALIVGIGLPILGQHFLASLIAKTSNMSSLVNGVIVTPTESTISTAILMLAGIGAAYLFVIICQIRYLAIFETMNSAIALFITIIGPPTIWFIIPLALPLIQ